MKLCGDKQCTRANQLLSLDQFCVNKRREDQRNLYCKECSVRRNQECRDRKRERREARLAALEAKVRVEKVERKPTKLSPEELVTRELRKGPRTRDEIKEATELDEQIISDVLADHWDREAVRIIRVGEKRVFHLRVAA